jgi:heme-degrading monooxygenase HmoA
MIARSWRGRTTIANQNAYIDHFRTNVLPELRGIDGFVGATLLKEESAGEVAFLVLTQWKSKDAIRAFAGADIERAVVEPEAARVLLSFDATVQHWEVVDSGPGS